MIPQVQSRIGERGTCFRTCIASLLNLREADVPDFPEANLDPGVNKFLRQYGLTYKEIPAEDDNAPIGLHLALGTSPRGGQHAVVAKDGKLLHDPHPVNDDPRRGLVDTKAYGLLLPLKREAKDAAPLKGKRLHTAAELLRAKHDEVMYSPARFGSTVENMYRATNRPVMDLVNEAANLLAKAKLDDDPVYWQGKLATAKKALEQATVNARQGGYERAVQQQEYALTLAHMVIDKMRNTGRAQDADLRIGVTKCQQCGAKLNGDDVAEIGRKVVCPECADEHHKATDLFEPFFKGLLKSKDLTELEWRALSKPEQSRLEREYEVECARARRMKARGALHSKAKDALDKRARLHRALDCVMDRSFGKDLSK